ncbi:MAG: hypothetical protein II943_06655 [Victivallales bacterium]|nr:hypothetical protein [Victivallales bacterium]
MAEERKQKKSHWGRKLAIGFGITLAVLVIAVMVINANLGRIVRKALVTWGPKLTGTDIQVEDIDISVIRGDLKVKNLLIGNPEGYKTPSILEIGELHVKMDTRSIFSDIIHIQLIEIKEPKVTYEVGLGNSNVSTLLDRLTKAEEAEEKEEEESESSKRVVIDQVNVDDGSIHLAAKVTGGYSLPIPLPDIHLSDIGKTKEEVKAEAIAKGEESEEGATPLRATCEILTSIFSSTISAVGNGASAAVQGVKDAAGAAVDGVKNAAGAAVDGVKNLFGGDK